VVSVKPVQDWPGPLQRLPKEMASGNLCDYGAVQTMPTLLSHVLQQNWKAVCGIYMQLINRQ